MQRIGLLLLAVSLVALAPRALHADHHAEAKNSDPKIPFEKFTLDNGLEVILHQDNSVPLVAVNVWYHVGSGDEKPGKSGFAHLFEHMMFQGSKHVGEDKHFAILRAIGGSGVNGTTNTDRTNYFETVPSHELETALWLESDRMGYMLPLLTEESFRNQVDVVRNERRQNYDNRPYRKGLFAKAAALYPEGHPYRYLTIGRHEDLENASLADVRAFYEKWYAPSNATLVLAGDFDKAAARKLVEKYFGSLRKTTKPERQQVPAPVLSGRKRIVIEDALAKNQRIEYVWPSPALYKKGDAELDLIASTLGATGTGRLYKRLVHKTQLAQSVSVYQASRQFSSEFVVAVTLKTGADLARVEKIINQELEKVRTAPMSKAEFDRAVIRMESSFVWGLESLMSRAQTLQGYNHFLGKPDFITQDLDRWRKSSPDQAKVWAKRVLHPVKRVEALTVPATAKKGGK